MSTKIRPWVALVAVGVMALSVLVAVSRRSGKATLGKPGDASTAQAPASQTGGAVGDMPANASSVAKDGDREPVRIAVPRKAKAILRDGKIVPAKDGRASLGDPGVMAVVYEGAPPAAVQRLKEILESGSNEYPDFTLSEKYPPWVYDKIREMLPGKLGEVIARIAEDLTKLPPHQRDLQPHLDCADVDRAGYRIMYLVSDQAKAGVLSSTPVADTRFGTVVVSDDGMGPAEVAVWLAHRLAAGDGRITLPRIPPETYGDWQSWVKHFVTEEYARELGLLAEGQTS